MNVSKVLRITIIALTLVQLSTMAPVRAFAAEQTLVVGKASADVDTIIPVNVGDQLGFFKKHGLNLKIVNFNGGAKMVQALAAGSIDIGVGDQTSMALIARGAPMLAVCQTGNELSTFSIGVPWNSPIKSIKQLKGKIIGISTNGSLSDWLAQELASSQGWAPGSITEVPIGISVASVTAAFRQHLIDAMIGGTASFLNMAQHQAGRVLVPVSDYVPNVASGTIYASDGLIKSNGSAIRAFLASWLDTIAYMRTHKAEIIKIESSINGYPQPVMSADYDIVIGMYSDDCKFSSISLAKMQSSFIDLKELDTPPDMSKLYTEAFSPGSKPQ